MYNKVPHKLVTCHSIVLLLTSQARQLVQVLSGDGNHVGLVVGSKVVFGVLVCADCGKRTAVGQWIAAWIAGRPIVGSVRDYRGCVLVKFKQGQGV